MGLVEVVQRWSARRGAANAMTAVPGLHRGVPAEVAAGPGTDARFGSVAGAPSGPQPVVPLGLKLGSQLGSWVRRYTVRNERLRLCETLALGGRRSLVLVECDGQRFLAGLSADGVQTLVPVTAAAAARAEEAA